MGINIAICELEAENAKCREYKTKVVKVMLKDLSGFEDAADFNEIVPIKDAKALFPDFEAFLKRNRLNDDIEAVYMEKVKNDNDRAILLPKVQKKYTGWVSVENLDGDRRKKALELADKDDTVTGWNMIGFEGMNEICASCPLSWDKGRGCMGAFGPDNSGLPDIAAKKGCSIIASVPECAKVQKRLTPEDASVLLKEVAAIREILPEEGKMAVRRYTGPLDRMEAVANISVREKCGFFFF